MSRTPALRDTFIQSWVPALFCLILVAVTIAENSATRLYVWPWIAIGEALFLIPPLFLVLLLVLRKHKFGLGPWIEVGLVGFAASSLLSALVSPMRWFSVELAAPYVFLVALVFGITDFLRQKPSRLPLFTQAVGAMLSLVFIVSFKQWLSHDVLPNWSRVMAEHLTFNRNAFPFGHSNYTAGFSVLAFPWLACLAWRSVASRRILWAAAALACVALLATTGSRGGLAGFATTLILGTAFWCWKGQLSRGKKYASVGIAILATLALALHEPRTRNLILHQQWDVLASASNEQRTGMSEAGVLMGRAHPVLGSGPGIIPLVYPKFRAQLSGGVENVLELHNTYLQLWSELGLVGLIFLLSIGIGVFQRIRGLLTFSTPPSLTDERAFALAGALGLLSYAVMAATDHQLDLPMIGFLIACDLALLCFGQREETHAQAQLARAPSLVFGAAAAGSILLSIVYSWPNIKARAEFSSALDAASVPDEKRFVELASEAVRTAPLDTAYVNALASWLIEARAKAPAATSIGRAAQINDCFQYSLRVEPDQEYVRFNLGWLALEVGNAAAARKQLLAAAHLVPDKGGVYLGIALADLAEQRPDDASAALALEALNDPAFLASPWWKVSEILALKPAVSQRLGGLYKAAVSDPASTPALMAKGGYSLALSRWLLGVEIGANVAKLTENLFQKNYLSLHPTPSELLAAPSISYRRERTGYPVLTRHADFPAPHDIYLVRENRLAADQLSGLFPAKGWLPTSLLARLASASLVP